MKRKTPSYLGDGVYVSNDGYQIWLRANDANWGHPTPEIALEPQVIEALLRYAVSTGFIKGMT